MPHDSEQYALIWSLSSTPPVGAPVSFGIPLPKGLVRETRQLQLDCIGPNERATIEAQWVPLAYWPDQSLRAVRLDYLTTSANLEFGMRVGSIARPAEDTSTKEALSGIAIRVADSKIQAEHVDFGVTEIAFPFTHEDGRVLEPQWQSTEMVCSGPLRSVTEFEGNYVGVSGLQLKVSVSAFRDCPLLEVRVRVRNARRARHRGGLWDLGDPNTLLFQAFDVLVQRHGVAGVEYKLGPDHEWREGSGDLNLYQDSSGGENWNCANHVNRQGRVPCRFQGFELRKGEFVAEAGRRATPIIRFTGNHAIAVTTPDFWQQFPKSMAVESERIRVGLFPREWDDLHELQPGEQKTHDVWVGLDQSAGLGFVHQTIRPIFPASWYAECGLFDSFPLDPQQDTERYRSYITTAVDPQQGFAARRDVIDEYGWRHWGDLWADHEQLEPDLANPIVSHYNNQYDLVEGCLRHFARSGNLAWWEVAEPLARHARDIDIYHTDEDRAVYNHGFFWHTDHYLPAKTATHRTYSRQNADQHAAYGGGPSSSHCYSTGFLHLYYLTGDPTFRETVIQLAEWLIGMEDGTRTEFCTLAVGPTGHSTISAEPWYHGPGRGPANTLNTLVDAWELTGDRRYRDHAEMIIRRVVAPGESIDALELLDVERRWFYIMFLLALAKYLGTKIDFQENDKAYAYAVAVIQDYADWMLKNERPYLDHPEKLEHPTETWCAQDVRKANAMRRMARFCDTATAARLVQRSQEIAERGWETLLAFDTHSHLRPMAIMLVEGLRDEFFRKQSETPPPEPHEIAERTGHATQFVPQRELAKAALRSPTGVLKSVGRTLNPIAWGRLAAAVRARF